MTGYLLINAQLLDLESGELRPGASIRVEDDTIVEVQTEQAPPLNRTSATVIDCRSQTLLPGLIDAHVHASITSMDLSALRERRPTRIGIETKAVLEAMLMRGFTTVRDAGGLDRGVAEAVSLGLVAGPRVKRSGRFISQTGGHGDDLSPDRFPLCSCEIRTSRLCHVADGVDAVRRAVREELKDGAHQIKVMASGGVASEWDPVDMVQYTEAEIAAAVEEATARRTYAFAHAYIPEAIERAVRAGVRSVEHGNMLDRRTAEFMATNGVFLVPTLIFYQCLSEIGEARGFPPAGMAKLAEILAAGTKSVELALDAGVNVGFGTDLLGEMHNVQSREFLIRSQVQSPLDVIRSATSVNAELLQEPRLGSLRPGSYADILVVNGDPSRDIALLTGQGDGLNLIMRAGRIVKNGLETA